MYLLEIAMNKRIISILMCVTMLVLNTAPVYAIEGKAAEGEMVLTDESSESDIEEKDSCNDSDINSEQESNSKNDSEFDEDADAGSDSGSDGDLDADPVFLGGASIAVCFLNRI